MPPRGLMALRAQGLFTEYLTRAKRWVAAANGKWGTDVKITSVALDSEKFAFANAHHAVVGQPDWVANLTRKSKIAMLSRFARCPSR